jgi:hypothetical protein
MILGKADKVCYNPLVQYCGKEIGSGDTSGAPTGRIRFFGV